MGPLILRNFVVPLSYPKLSDLFVNGAWFLDGVRQHLDAQLIQEVHDAQITLSADEDVLIWKYTTLGNFSIKSAWDLIKQHNQINIQAALIWKQAAPPSAQLMCWKLMKGILPMDSTFQRGGVAMVSRCVMCCNASETPTHLFIDCSYVSSLWDKIAAFWGFQLIAHEEPITRLTRLARIYEKDSLSHALVRSISLLDYWVVWKERCRRLFEDWRQPPFFLFMIVMHIWRLQSYCIRPKVLDSPTEKEMLAALNVYSYFQISIQVKWIS